MTGRENQLAWYLRDRWNVAEKLTLNAGLRLDYYPLMNRVGRGIERLDYSTYQVILGGIGGQPDNAGINYKAWYVEPRVGAAYRLNENTVFRAGYGQTKNPLPWSRPMRGSYPFDINNNATAAGTYDSVTTLAQGIPAVNLPDTSSGIVTLPSGVFIRSPNPDDVDRGTVHQWNVTFERRLPLRMSAEISYVGTATNGGYADLNVNVGVPGRWRERGEVLRSRRHDGDQRLGGAHQGPVQGPAGRAQPAVQGRLDAQGCVHLEPVQGHGGRGRVDWAHLELPAEVQRQLRDLRLRPDARVPDWLAVPAAVLQERHGRNGCHPRRLADQRRRCCVLGNAVPIGGTNNAMACTGLRVDPDQLHRERPKATGSPDPGTLDIDAV